MIQALSRKYRQTIAVSFLMMFYMQLILPSSFAAGGGGRYNTIYIPSLHSNEYHVQNVKAKPFHLTRISTAKKLPGNKNVAVIKQPILLNSSNHIGGPSSPEATSFKAVGSDNLVNLFTGDFSYSIPLLDVGGYPVNLFYNGGISMEQEASWVGLGWNINPGSVSRNMRGVPDDFDGTDTLIQTQNVKPNKTWGGEVGADGEALGFKTPSMNFNVGFSYNNYLGPELDLGSGISVSIPIANTEVHEAYAPNDSSQGLKLNFGASAKLSSRSGLTLSPSLNANLHSVSNKMDMGVGLSTSYNSRTGIKDLNLTSQMTLYRSPELGKDKSGVMQYGHNQDHLSLSNSSISFAKPSYTPTLRMPMQYSNFSGQLEVGLGMFGLRGAGTLQGYYSESKVATTTIYKPLVGFLYLEKANGRKDAVMDFNRLNDGEVTPNTPIISAPQYDYDVFSIQGEGTGGSIRAYRGDLGLMKDNETTSRDNNLSIGFDIAPVGHYGGNLNKVSSPTRAGGWDDANNTLNQTLQFTGAHTNSSFENVYFRNPGETTVTNDDMLNKIGRDNLVRFKIDGSAVSPRLESQLEQFSGTTNGSLGTLSIANANSYQQRDKRTQVITMLTAADAQLIGLDKVIKSYLPTLDPGNNLQYTSIPRVGGYRKDHHISEVDVLEQSGMRYVYGLPVYNTVQEDFTFSVRSAGDPATNLVPYTSDEPTINSASITSNNGVDGYFNMQKTPAYASSFLITGLLSPDYVDVTGDGITEDDLGNAVKFNYTQSADTHKWRTPRTVSTPANIANFNAGLRSERRDNKATISYGEREAWYMHSIESKSMIAIFKTSARSDAKGVNNELDGTVKGSENANLKLDSILLYTKADIKANGLLGAIPLKTVHFDYSYTLCGGTPDNKNAGVLTQADSIGKLTLKDIYFTFNGQPKASKNRYVFNYGTTTADNPVYAYNASDRWGTYKPAKDPSSGTALNPGNLTNIDYPYTDANKTRDDAYVGAWALKKILLPSGGQIEVQYEADDYGYVQNRRACNLFNVYGLGSTTNYTQSNNLYTVFQNQDQNYVYVQLPAPLQNTDPSLIRKEIYAKYLDGINQLAFKLFVNMPKGMEPLTVYANYDDYGLCTNSSIANPVIYLQLRPVNGKGPLSNASVQFLINSLPGQAFPNYDLSEEPALPAFLDMLGGALTSFTGIFMNAEGQVKSGGGGSTISLANSFVRLDAPTLFKYGGGYRVKRVLLKDNWNAMSGQYDSKYGQDYDYTTTAMVNGVPTTISSGVASYEPGIGSEENPFREILQFQDKLPLASAQYGAIEMPMLEGLYPSPEVGYSKVTVRSIHRNGTHGDSVVRSAIGKQVTEFYTAKDYPTFSAYTPMSNMDYHFNPPFSFLFKETIDKRTTSQGFLVETNDMHGKMRSQTVYSEGDEKTPLSYTYHTYKNTGANGFNDKVDFVHNDQSGAVSSSNMGIDAELMTDARELDVQSIGFNGQIQTDFFSFVPWPIFSVVFYPLVSYTENKYRAVTTTKLINFHAIEDSVIVNDKGSVISTKTIAYDAETGSPIVTQTANEFNDLVYNATYPAYWAYSGVAPAYKNIGMQFNGVTFNDGRIISGVNDPSIFESGDELYITHQGSGKPTCIDESQNVSKLWVLDSQKDTTALTVPNANKSLLFLDSAGNLFTKADVNFRIVRSGKRNNLSLTASSTSAMLNPIQIVNNTRYLVVNNTDNVVASSATEFREKWQTDGDDIQRFSLVTDPSTCNSSTVQDCNGFFQHSLNPYCKGMLGNLRAYRSYTYYGKRNDTDVSVNAAIRHNGYINGFTNFWNFNAIGNLIPAISWDVDHTTGKIVYNRYNWVWNSALERTNTKGQELETKDALNIYSAVQYGYAKNLPIAAVQNSRYGQAFEESFEDYNYLESLNKFNSAQCDNNRYISFNGITNSSIVTIENLNTKAHTGKYALMINPSSSATKILSFYSPTYPIYSNPAYVDYIYNPNRYDPDYSINFNQIKPTTSTLVDIGFNVQKNDGSLFNYSLSGIHTTGGLFSGELPADEDTWVTYANDILSFQITHTGYQFPENSNTPYYSGYSLPVTQYFTIPQQGNYTIEVGVSTSNPQGSGDPFINGGNAVVLTNLATNLPYNPSSLISTVTADPITNFSVVSAHQYQYCLPAGVYSLTAICARPESICTCCGLSLNPCPKPTALTLSDHYWVEFKNLPAGTNITGYRTLKATQTSGCMYTAPMAAASGMINDNFSLVRQAKMQFSAWVKEDCGNAMGTPCYISNYANSSVTIQFPNPQRSGYIPNTTVLLKPNGPIIDGWQKVEGVFTPPQDATDKAELVFNNAGSRNIYFDDLRIHPFNANMKSYVYDPRTLRLSAELDENNYATFYDYDEEGQLIRVKKETIQGIKTIQETRSAKQKTVTTVQ